MGLKINKFKQSIQLRTAENRIATAKNYIIIDELALGLPDSRETGFNMDPMRINCKKIKAVVLESCPVEFILGYEDICKYDITTKFKELFAMNHPVKNSRDQSANARTVNPSSSAVKDQGKPADGMTDTRPSISIEQHHHVAQTAEPVPEARDEHFGASGQQAARVMSVELAQPHEIVKNNSTVPKEKLLTVDPDDDDIEKFQPINPWSHYFTAAQSHKNNRHAGKPTTSSDDKTTALSLTEILKNLKLHERCNDSKLRAQLERIVTQFQDRFAVNVASEPAAIPPFRIEVDQTKWSLIKPEKYPRPQSEARQMAVDKFIRKALADNIIRPSHSNYFSQVLLTPKANGTWRFCVDYRRVNELTKPLGWPIPNIENLLRRIGAKRAKYFATLDYTSGYYQAPLEESSKKYTAFITQDGIYEFNRVPMGPKGAPAYFQQQMQHSVFPDFTQSILEIYLDDIITWSDTPENLGMFVVRDH
jgi:hypothetical protein